MSNAHSQSAQGQSYYSVLGLPTPQRPGAITLTAETLKQSYRRALLLHHPDKIAGSSVAKRSAESVPLEHHFSIDQILEAYETLLDPVSRSQYDEALLKNKARLVTGDKSRSAEGLDTFDLEDLDYDEASQNWSRSCRCGGTYTVKESQLEQAASEREIIASCHGCSLCIKIIFDMVVEPDGDATT